MEDKQEVKVNLSGVSSSRLCNLFAAIILGCFIVEASENINITTSSVECSESSTAE